jgi:hypothetical protein
MQILVGFLALPVVQENHRTFPSRLPRKIFAAPGVLKTMVMGGGDKKSLTDAIV